MGILGELWVKLGLRNEALDKGLDDSKKKVSGFANYMSKLGGIMAAAFSVKEIVAFTHQTAELANKAAGVRRAFDKLNNPNLLADLRRATLGTVDDLQLMQRAVQAQNFKISLDQLATYLQFATKRANETGQSVDYLVDSIIIGLGRQSTLILDNLGFSAAQIRDNMKDGASVAEAVGKIIKEQMGDGAAEIDKAVLATDRLKTAWTNLMLTIGAGTSGPWNWIKGQVAGFLEDVTSVLNSNNLNFWQKLFTFNPITGLTMFAAGTYDRAFAKDAEDAAKAIEKLKKETEEYNKLVESGEFIGPMPGTGNGTVAVTGLIGKLEEEIKKKKELRNLSANEDEVRQLNDEIEALKEKLRLLQMTSEEYKEYQASLDKTIKPVMIEGIFDNAEIKSNIDTGAAMLDEAQALWTEKGAALAEITVAQQEMITEAAQMLANSLTSGINNSLNELVNVIAGVEGANAGNVVKALLTPLADAAISAGIMILTTGKAVAAFRTALQTLDPAVGVAAGATLIAVGLAAKAGLQAIGNNPTAAGGYANSSVTSYSGGYGVNSNNYAQEATAYSLTTTLKGQDLLLAIQRTENNNRR